MKKITLLLIMFAFASTIANAQTQISPEKEKAIKEIITLIDQDNRSVEIAKAVMNQMDEIRKLTIKSLLDERDDLSNADKISLEKTLTEDSANLSKRFQEKLFKKVNYGEIMSGIFMTLYDKYYTLEEINDLIIFYKTPTGQKTLKLMQPLMTDSMKLSQEKLVPLMLPIVQETIEEEREELKQKANKVKPRKTK